MSAGIGKRNPILRCAIADLVYEWPLNLCVALGIAALLFPLAVLYGLKYGAVSVLENRLMNDPRSRELRPSASGFFSHEWLAEQQKLPGVGFVVGLPKAVASSLSIAHEGESLEATVLPTGTGDPLLESGDLPVPDAAGCVISAPLAQSSGLRPGDRLQFSIARRAGSGWQSASASLSVAGVLPDFALDYPAVLVLPSTADAVEDFFDGLPVPQFGWQGSSTTARPAYDGALLFTRKEGSGGVAPGDWAALLDGTGFTTLEKWDGPGLAVESTTAVYFLTNANALVDESNVELLARKVSEQEGQVIPWLRDRKAEVLLGNETREMEIRAWSPALREFGLDLAPDSLNESGGLPWCGVIGGSISGDKKAHLCWRGVAGEITVPLSLRANASIPGNELWLDAQSAGILRRSLERGLELREGEFVTTRRGYASFRMAARSIEDVLPLQKRLEAGGVRVTAETQRIADIQFLEGQLETIFALFALVAGVGVVTCLLAIAFSAAERKKRVLAFLQILGSGRWRTARFPLYQCVVLSLGGAAIAWVAHSIFSGAVNRIFSARLLPGERLSALPWEAAGIAVGALLIVSVLCYLLVLPRFVGMPLGEAAREP